MSLDTVTNKVCVAPRIVAKTNHSGNEYTAIFFNSVAQNDRDLFGKYTIDGGLLHWVDDKGKRWVAPDERYTERMLLKEGYVFEKAFDTNGVRAFSWDKQNQKMNFTIFADDWFGSGEYVYESIPVENVVPDLLAVLKVAR